MLNIARAFAFLAVVAFGGSAVAQPGPGQNSGPVPPPSPWLYAAPQIYPPTGSCVTMPQTVPGGCPGAGNAINVSGGYYLNGVALDSISSVTPPLSVSSGVLSILNGTSIANPGTGTLEDLVPSQTITGTSKVYATVDLWKRTRRSNSGTAMTDTLPASSATGMVNGARIEIKNVDASATDTVSAGAGTTIIGGASFSLQAGRDLELTYDLANTTWRAEANTDTAALINQPNFYSADNYFGSGRPVCDPRAKGAVGNGSTDDSAAFKACRVALDAIGGGVIYVPPGNYCLKTADANNAVIAISATPITVIGAGINVSNLWTCGTDVTIGYANIVGAGFLNLSYLGKGGQGNPNDTTFGATSPAFKFDTSCGICRISYVRGFGGLYALQNLGFDSWVSDFSFGYTYGNAIMYEAGNGHRVEHGALDQNWPVVLPNQNSVTISAWQATHSYSGNGASNTNVVSTQGYNIQLVSASCTSGGTAPPLNNYGTVIVDGSCSWQLVGNTTYYGEDCDGNCAELILHGEVDLNCGGCTYDFAMTNNNAGTAPNVVTVDGSSIGQAIIAPIGLLAGSGFTLSNSHIATSVQGGALGLYVPASGFTGDASIVGNRFSGGGACIGIGTAPSGQAGYTITANRFLSCSQAIDYFNTGAALHITAGHNTMVGVSNAWVSPAGSSYYEFTNNDVGGAAVTFTSGDANKKIAGNDGSATPVSNGGTGLATLTAHAVLLGEGAGNVAFATIGTGGRLLIDQGAVDPVFTAMSGDAALAASGALTLATVNGNVGTFGGANAIPSITVNGKGLVTAVSTVAPNPTQVNGVSFGAAPIGTNTVCVATSTTACAWSSVPNAALANSTISGVSLGGSLAVLSYGTHLTNGAGAGSYNGSAASTLATDATNTNTASTIVARDGSGNFSAGTVTASLTGHASLDLALTGGAMSGNIAMAGNSLTGAMGLNGVETILSGGNIGFGTETNPQAAFVFSANTTTGITFPVNTSGLWSISANSGNVPGFNALAFATNGSNFFFRADGTAASPTALALNDNIGAITWGGYAGSTAGYVSSKARIAGIVIDASGYGTSTQGTGIEFDATPSGSTTRAQAGRFMAGFIVGTGTTDPGAGNELVGGHILATGTAPTISACGTGTPTISGGDNFGTVVAGTVATSCVVNFGATWGAAPRCAVSSGTAIASLTVSATTTQLTITGTALGGDTINWVCGSTASLEPNGSPANDNAPPWLSKAA
jgi:hypothetical protein